jgi:hypothetical protein
MGFVLLSEQTAIISVNSINRFIFVMETCYVFFEVGTKLILFKCALCFKRLMTDRNAI